MSRSLIVIYLQKIFKPFNVFFTPQRFQLKWRSEGIRWGEGLHESREVDRVLRHLVQSQYLVRFSTIFAAILEGLTWNAR